MMNIAFFQSKGLSCNTLISETKSATAASGIGGCASMKVHTLFSGAGSLIQISRLFPVASLKAFSGL